MKRRTIRVDAQGNELETPNLASVGKAYAVLQEFSNRTGPSNEDEIFEAQVACQCIAFLLDNSSIQINVKGDKLCAIHVSVNG